MKKVISTLFFMVLLITAVIAQSPNAVNYQAVARNGAGILLANQALTVQLGVYAGAGASTLVYEETQTVTTNTYGQFSLKIGQGTPTFGTFATIDWANDEHHLKVQADPGSGLVNLGTTQLVTVPYAFHSTTSNVAVSMLLDDLVDVNTGGMLAPGELLSWNGTQWGTTSSLEVGPWIHKGNDIYYSGGKVGIGTSTPGTGLAVKGVGGYESAISLENTTSGTNWSITSWTSGSLEFVRTSGAPMLAMTIEPTSGNVGIGNNSPSEKLCIYKQSAACNIRLSNSVSGFSTGLRVGLNATGDGELVNEVATKDLIFGTGGVSHAVLDELGHFGVHQLSPAMMLHVKQDVSNTGLRLEHNTTTNYWDNGIGVSTNNYKFYYNGNLRADISSVDGAYTQASDRRLKRDIVYMEPVLGKVAQLRPATYHYIDGAPDAVRSIGFVAQEVETLFPDLVRETDNGMKGLVCDGFAVISIKAIQELNEKVDALQKEVDALKAQSQDR